MKKVLGKRKPKQLKHVQVLMKLNACSEAVEFSAKHKTLQYAWNVCERGDWMLWLLGKFSGPIGSDSRKRLLLVSAECARLALPYTKSPKVLKCIEVVEAYTRNEVSIAAVIQARQNLYAVDAVYAADAAAAYAAYAAAAAAYAVYAAAAAAAYDADAAAAAYDADAAYAADAAAAAAYAADDAARSKILKQCADIVRKHYPEAPKL